MLGEDEGDTDKYSYMIDERHIDTVPSLLPAPVSTYLLAAIHMARMASE